MIPEFDSNGNLPPGIYRVKWDLFVERFGHTPHRSRLCEGLLLGITALARVGCVVVYIDGSFVTSKEVPNDFDACWDDRGINWTMLKQIEPTLLKFGNSSAAQKSKFKGEFFPAFNTPDDGKNTFLSFFQNDRDGNPKGIVAIDLKGIKI
jgi:hypothetical protein